MRKRRIALLGTVILAAAILAGIFMKMKQPEKVYMSASWIYGYADVEELTGSSDLIALIKVNGLSQNIEGRVPASVYEATVLDNIWGCEEKQRISVYMTGGKMDNQIFEIKTDPLMKEGQEFLIFAQKNQDGTYTVLGGPQGRLVYRKGVLNSLQNTDLPYVNAQNNADTAETAKFVGLVNVQNETLEDIKGKINRALTK